MECRVSFGTTSKGTLDINLSAAKKVKEYKEEIGEALHIQPYYIVLRYDDVILKDEDCLDDITEVEMLLETTVIRVLPVDFPYSDKNRKILMDYDDRVDDLRRTCCEEFGVRNVKLSHSEVLDDDELLRNLQCAFKMWEQLKVTVVDRDGGNLTMDVFEDCTVQQVKDAAYNRGCITAILMLGHLELQNESPLFDLGCRRTLTVHEGFFIGVCRMGECLGTITVNVDMPMSTIPGLVKAMAGLEGQVTLRLARDDIPNQGTVGSAELREWSILELVERIKIKVSREEGGWSVQYFLEKGDTVGDIKTRLTQKCGGGGRLLWNNQELEDFQTIDSVNNNEDLDLTLVEETSGFRRSCTVRGNTWPPIGTSKRKVFEFVPPRTKSISPYVLKVM